MKLNKIEILIVITALLWITVRIATAQVPSGMISQTNLPTVAQTTNSPIVVNNASEAFGAFLHYEYPNISFSDFMIGLGFISPFLARYARKIIPDKLQVNSLGLLLAHWGGEINPSIAKLSQAAASPTAVPMEQPAAAVPIPPPAQSLTPPPNATAASPQQPKI